MRTFGVEEEFLIFSEAGDQVVSQGAAVVADAERHLPQDAQVDEELKEEQAETGSAPVSTVAELREQLAESRRNLAAAANGRGLALAAMGTNPLVGGPTTTDKDRYQQMQERFALLAAEQLTCGQHVHVSVESREEGIAVIDRLQPWLPTLRAMSANSPYWQGEDTGYASYRTIRWGQWPTAGPNEPFETVANYESLVNELTSVGAALDDGMIYFDCRLSSRYPTVEIRVADVCTELDDAVLLGAVCRALVQAVSAQPEAAVPRPRKLAVLRGAHWRAARYGLSDSLLGGSGMVPAAEAVEELFTFIRPALIDSDDESYVCDGLRELLARGGGAAGQRAAFARTGALEAVVQDVCARTVRA